MLRIVSQFVLLVFLIFLHAVSRPNAWKVTGNLFIYLLFFLGGNFSFFKFFHYILWGINWNKNYYCILTFWLNSILYKLLVSSPKCSQSISPKCSQSIKLLLFDQQFLLVDGSFWFYADKHPRKERKLKLFFR